MSSVKSTRGRIALHFGFVEVGVFEDCGCEGCGYHGMRVEGSFGKWDNSVICRAYGLDGGV